MINTLPRYGEIIIDRLYVRDYWVIIPSIIIGLLLSFSIVYPGSQTYNELTAGAITWIDESKSQDYLSIIIFLFGSLLTLAVLNGIVNKLHQYEDAGVCLYSRARDALLLSSTPLLFYIANAWSYNSSVKIAWLVLSGLFILISLAPLVKWRNYDYRVLTDNYNEIVASACIVVASSIFTPAGLYLAGLRYKAYINSEISIKAIQLLSASFGIASLVLMVVVFLFSRNINASTLRMRRLSVLVQVGIPFLFLLMIPAPWAGSNSYSMIPKPELFIFTGMLVLASFALLIYQLLNVRNKGITVMPLTIAAIIIFMKMPYIGVPNLSADDYHLGEVYLPWMQFEQFGQVFYSGYDPARGLYQALAGYVGELFFDGSASAITLAMTYIGSAVMILFGVVAWWTMGSLFAIFALLLIPFPLHLILELLIILLLMLDKRVIGRPYTWLLMYVVFSIALVLYRPQTSPALVIALSVVFFYIISDLYKRGQSKQTIIFFVVMLVVTQLVNLYMPLNEMVFGILHYIYHHAEVNSVAHSSIMSTLLDAKVPLSLHMMRLIFLLFILFIAVLLVRSLRDNKKDDYRQLVLISVGFFLLVLIPYLFGRVGAGVTRGPIYAVYYIAILTPFLVYKYAGVSINVTIVYLSIVCASLLFPQKLVASGAFLKNIRLETVVDKKRLLSGESDGVPRYGVGYGKSDHLNQVAKLKLIMDILLKPDETYLDITNRNALYFYLGRKVPFTSGAIYNLPSRKLQSNSLDKIRSEKVPVVLGGYQSQRFDGGAAPIRTYLFYKYIMDNYIPVVIENDIVVFLSYERYEHVTGINIAAFNWSELSINYKIVSNGDKAVLVPGGKTKDRSIEVVNKIFHQKYLRKLPIAWGKSIDRLISEGSMSDPVTSEQNLNVQVGKEVNILSNAAMLRGAIDNKFKRPGLIEIDIQCKSGALGGSVYVITKSSVNGTTLTTPYNIELPDKDVAKLLIPMDVSPTWLLSSTVSEINVHAIHGCDQLVVDSAASYNRSD